MKKFFIIIIVLVALTGCNMPWDRTAGCTSPEWVTPSGEKEIFGDGSLSPDGKWLCQAEAPGGPYGWVRSTAASAPADPACDDSTTPPPPHVWEGDNMSEREYALPGIINSPRFGAIAEIWDGAQYCALIQILPGETWDGTNWKGAYWLGESENAVADRWPHHRQEFLATHSNCHVLESATLVP